MTEIESKSAELGAVLAENGWTITTAESCTGGGISAAITEIAGSSAYFEQSFITYSNAAKTQLVGVEPDLLEQFGAVSSQVVEAMALGALNKAGANVAIAVSGIAGPGGGSDEKPVGTVYIAVAIQYLLDEKPQYELDIQRCLFDGDRTQVRNETIKTSIINALELINKNK